MNYRFSYSSLNLLKECPRCFWLHFRKNIRRPSTPFPSLPSGMDNILKSHFDRYMELGKLPPELEELNGDVHLFEDKELLERWRNWRRGIRWMDKNGNLFMGAVDNVLQKGDKLIILDYKTRGYPLKDNTHTYYIDQLNIYNLLLRKNGYETEDYSYLLFYHPEIVEENGAVVFNTDLLKIDVDVSQAELIFSKALEVLRGEPPTPADNCGFCKWVDECRN